MLNYSMFGTHYDFDDDKSDRFQSSFEFGFNAGDWIVRSSQFISDGSDMSFGEPIALHLRTTHLTDYGVTGRRAN